jgi:hypothetical protein
MVVTSAPRRQNKPRGHSGTRGFRSNTRSSRQPNRRDWLNRRCGALAYCDIRAKNGLNKADAHRIEEAFQIKLAGFASQFARWF